MPPRRGRDCPASGVVVEGRGTDHVGRAFSPLGPRGIASLHNQRADKFKKVVASGHGAVAELVGIEVGVVSGVFNLESSGVEASDWRPRHDEQYHEA